MQVAAGLDQNRSTRRASGSDAAVPEQAGAAPPRTAWVDTAKGVSIILVVMMYAAFNTGEYTGGTGVLHYVVGFAKPFRMPEFFLISGLFLSRVLDRPWRRYVDRRVVHYLYFYVLWAGIMIALKVGLFGRDPVAMLREFAFAAVEPYGVLWFIYMLAIFGLAARLARVVGLPHWAVVSLAAALQMWAPQASSYVVTQFAAYFVFFYLGFVLAPSIFRLVAWFERHRQWAAAALLLWAVGNGLLVFSPGFSIQPSAVEMGWASWPPLHFVLAVVGAVAVCEIGAFLSAYRAMSWLRMLGKHSLVIYVAFTIPMSLFRGAMLASGLLTNTSLLSVAVVVVSILTPAGVYLLVKRSGLGNFLFERPRWAHITGPDRGPGVPSESRASAREPRLQAAE